MRRLGWMSTDGWQRLTGPLGGLVLMGTVLLAPQALAQSYTVLYSFTGAADGAAPHAGLARDPSGNLYGTTSAGGAANLGVVFKLDTAGKQMLLHSFTGGADGAGPVAGVILDSAGNLYGTAGSGGAHNFGVVYKVDPSGRETVLYSFQGGTDGANPYAGLARDSSGNLYGTTYSGGAANLGVVYKLGTAGQETVLYSFSGSGSTGCVPQASVTLDSSGNLYGTDVYSRTACIFGRCFLAGSGAVFKLDPAGHETVLHGFTGGADGEGPLAGVTRDPAGNLYGTTSLGGAANVGVVYKLDTTGKETLLYSFMGGKQLDGAYPYAGVVRDSAGNLYGTTFEGGLATAGVVYKLDTTGNLKVLYNFNGQADGAKPWAGVIRDSAGNLYGTTYFGGNTACPGGCGVVYKISR